ncbi:4'-phosphopantetheinyl transferase [Hyphomicrobium sp.]|uniref:4'-phosphopantetheinyl transferase family protein n=1 Tax=Hyphomicrobium sp. TaxID=82 RepID=UPI000FC0228D|nr:4'-phosphopantetheinyl transferase superfamily protein [Hyphomicrobium sp.]RUP10172.1 MAG: 4'-phosphopantetheinyl transferase superfamily protein [Hyphomicrobium sp.]
MSYFAGLLDARIAIAEAPLTGEPPCLLAGEAIAVAHAVPRRRLEFAKGRDCARKAMASLGHANASLPRGQDRMPVWPDELVGSITHTDGWTASAVARRDQGFHAIGIDLEPANELAFDLWDEICTPTERAMLAANCGVTPGVAAHFIFCLKEAAFKCQYPISGAMLEFADLLVDVDAQAGTFAATYQRAVPQFEIRDRLLGRFAIRDGYIASAVVVTTERTP